MRRPTRATAVLTVYSRERFFARWSHHTDAAQTVVSPSGDPSIITARYALGRRARRAARDS